MQLVFVLVGTSHSGNIGAAARAIKNMGFEQLRLVNACSHLTKDAFARASGADGVLENAQVFNHLDDAVADCQIVVGTSARQRQISVPLRDCRVVAEEVVQQLQAGVVASEDRRAAIVFGQERSGLKNDELDRCTQLLRIPCNPNFSSLNLGSAVQVVAYECSMALRQGIEQGQFGEEAESVFLKEGAPTVTTNPVAEQHVPASSQQMQHFFDHLQSVMETTGFLDPNNPRHLMRRIRGYFERNRPSDVELNIFRGILTSTQKPYPPKTQPNLPEQTD